MLKALALLASCAACSAVGDGPDQTATPLPQSYATQASAPSPNYRNMLNRPHSVAQGGGERAATATPPANAKAIGEAWVARLKKRGALLTYGVELANPNGPIGAIDVGLTQEEFDSWASANGWPVPEHIRWTFAPAFNLPPVSDAAKGAVRFWPASNTRTGIQLLALLHGRVELRDGCFFVGSRGGPVDKLAWFHAEIGLDKDAAGYFVLRDRVSGRTLTRLGENMSWGGPPSADIGVDAERALHDACGSADIVVVGHPQSRERFETQYPHTRELRVPPPPPPRRAR